VGESIVVIAILENMRIRGEIKGRRCSRNIDARIV